MGSLELTRTDTHQWSARADGIGLYVVRESRSGPSGKTTLNRVQVQLDDEQLARLDKRAKARGLSRSAAVAELVDAIGE